jgi:NADH-quinone oxidoreductase subunit M
MIALTAFLVPGLMLFSWEERLPEGRTASGYFALLLATEATLMGVFTATDVFLFYVFFEVMLIPMYFLIGRFGGPRRQYAAVKFFLYSLFGGLIMLASLIGLYVVSAQYLPAGGTFDWATLRTIVPLIPESPRSGSSSGSSSPSRSRRRWCRCTPGCPTPVPRRRSARVSAGRRARQGRHVRLPALLPAAVPAGQRAARAAGAGAVGDRHPVRGAARGGAEGHEPVRRLHLDRPLRLHRAGHLRLLDAGVRRLGALHGQPRPLDRHAVRDGRPARLARRVAHDQRLRRCGQARPGARRCFLLAGLSSLALPGTNSFVSEFLVLVGSFPREPVYTILATVGIVFAALYVLWVYQQTMQGPVRGRAVLDALDRGAAGGPGAMIDPAIAARRAGSGFPDLSVREITVLVPLIVAILVLGFFPGPVLDVVNPSVAATMTEVGLTDPVGGLPR